MPLTPIQYIIPGDGISFEQEMEKRAKWAAANQPISPFLPVQSLLGHPVVSTRHVEHLLAHKHTRVVVRVVRHLRLFAQPLQIPRLE